ncbi:MAG: hypothetical protein HZC10_05155 [Nitrospirae bacterium]|nr:hypothetical protein [Nitrospirota bacterium]
MKKEKDKIAEVINYKNVPSYTETRRENIRWFSRLSPIEKIRLLQKQKDFLRRMGVIK